MSRRVYMDAHATTPLDPRVLEAMLPFFTTHYGNAASAGHAFGWQAREAVERARAEVALSIAADPAEIVFTSGATESDNLALLGAARGAARPGAGHVISVSTEHRAVLDPLARLEQDGLDVERLPVDAQGRLDPDTVRRALRAESLLVSVMAANNEIGVLADLESIGALTRERDVLFHSDAAQALGRVPLNVKRQRIDLLSLSAHKIHGPKGVGALFVRGAVADRIAPLITGGGQEAGLRAGTANVPGIVGFGCAARLAHDALAAEPVRLAALRDRLHDGLSRSIDGVTLNGDPLHRLSNNLNVSFAGIDGQALLTRLDDVALSTGSACMSSVSEPSHVLEALGLAPQQVRGSVRFALTRFNTEDEVDYVVERVATSVRALRALSPDWPEAAG